MRKKTTKEIKKDITWKTARNTTEENKKNHHRPSDINYLINKAKPRAESGGEIDNH